MLLDDVGPGQLSAWEMGRTVAPTPTIDCLCRRGLRFSRAWAHTLCSPSRAQLYTGRLSGRNGVGRNVRRGEELVAEEITMAEVLAAEGYATGLVGKWHLGGVSSPSGLLGPNLQGFERFAGSLANLSLGDRGDPDANGYDHWLKVTDGQSAWTERYATEDVADEAIDFIAQTPSPWLLVTAFQAPHKPFHAPPGRLIGKAVPEDAPDDVRYRAALEALDRVLGELLASVEPEVLADTTVVLLADNGPPADVISPPLDRTQHKGTLTEGGLRVPLLIAGPHVTRPGTVSRALVHEVDLLPTLTELAGVPLPEVTLDGVSLMPLLSGSAASVRQTLIDTLPLAQGTSRREAVRDELHKLIRHPDGRLALFRPDDARLDDGPDLLLDGISVEESAILERLAAVLDASP